MQSMGTRGMRGEETLHGNEEIMRGKKMKLWVRGLHRKLLGKWLLVFAIWMLCSFFILTNIKAIAIPISFYQLKQGQIFYQNGQFFDAVQIWKSACDDFKLRHEQQYQALTLSYLALAYQQLGLPEAESANSAALELIRKSKDKFIYAQILNNQGQLLFSQGKTETALETWKQAQNYYHQVGNTTGEIGTQINQARALQTLGFYLRAKDILEQIQVSLNKQPDSQLKFTGLLNLGNVLRVIGDYETAEVIFQRGLIMAKKLHLQPEIKIALLNLGNLASSQQQLQTALSFYQEADGENSPVKLQTQIYQFEILIKLNNYIEAQKLLPQIQTLLSNVPPSQTTIYAQIELATNLVKTKIDAAQLLVTARKQAQILGIPRAESIALGKLAGLYEQTQQWQSAKNLTKQALDLAQTIAAPDIAYQWQWQMGRIFKATGQTQAAIANYTEAFETLRSLRQDLIAMNQDVQFSFRESVEPVYRELADLLLQDNAPQENIIAARVVIESLQLAEIANYLHYCSYNQTIPIEQIDANTALIYPIILRDRIEVILSIPGQPLRHYATPQNQTQTETIIKQMRQSLRRTSFESERLPLAQKIYTWLLEPAINDLHFYNIKTLVFKLDSYLRNIPMAALYDGKQYLIEQYQIAIAPNLQIPKPIPLKQIKVLIGGLSQATPEYDALPGVEQEIRDISAKVPTTVLLNQQFTTKNLQLLSKKQPFSVMHFATHGQFSSKPQNTYILTWKGRLNINELNTLLSDRTSPIELLVLSACQTAKGDERAALGIAGVAIRSGARSTLASLWTVSDESTPIFMSNFYQELLKPAVTKAEAVRQAQLHLLKNPNFSHPYYWALFILVGNWL
jgi:CHAT domain-containing protein/predicted negative regulator of RcsB-dependent stress response